MSGAAVSASRRPGRGARRRARERLARIRLRDGGGHRQWSRTVLLMKLGFLVAAFGLVALVIAWAQLTGRDGGFRVGFSTSQIETGKALRMVNARYSGLNKGTRPYLLTADEAIQSTPEADLVHLRNPKGDLTTGSGAWVALAAPRGRLHQEKQLLDLSGGVNLFHDSGLEFQSETAHIDLKTGTAHGNDPVTGHGPSSDLQAQGFRVLEDGSRILFTGKAKLVLYPSDGAAGGPATDGR